MCTRRFIVLLALHAVLLGEARAQESLDEIAGATTDKPLSARVVEVNGYFDNRFTYTLVDPGVTPINTSDIPSLLELAEANVQLRVHLGTRAFVYGDLSLFYQNGWLFYSLAPDGGRQDADNPDLAGNLPPHDRPSLRPFIVPSELYLSWSPASWFNVLVGKKRIVWGSGVAFNPTDLVNPPKDPTDPNLQRAGGWLARLELPFEKFTFTALAAPGVLYQQTGIPYGVLTYPNYPSAEMKAGLTPDLRDSAYHYLLAARLYALLWDTDIDLIYYFSNQYQDSFSNKSRFGVSLSRFFFTDYELHLEALFQEGSPRIFANHDCVNGLPCPDPIHNTFTASKLDADTIYAHVLAGFRTTFRDESTLSIEYLYQSDGDSDLEFTDRVKGLLETRRLIALGAIPNGGLPVRFGFDPLRRHYLIASFQKPKIHDDWSVGLVVIAGLRDLSALLSPSVGWTPAEWVQLTLYGYVPVRGIPVGEAEVGGQSYSEFGMSPFDLRMMFEARFFY